MNEVSDDKLEQLLRNAEPRVAPDPGVEEEVRAAVHAEWAQSVRSTGQRRRARWFAMAASVAIAVAAGFAYLVPSFEEPIQVAVIQKNFGSIYILESSSTLTPVEDLGSIREGQTIVTGKGDSGLALAWHGGGSLRLDSDSEIEFTAADVVRLKRGKLYFDTQPAALIASIDGGGSPALAIETEFGRIEHLGTQYMIEVAPREMAVSVREGEVSVTTRGSTATIATGKRGEFSGRGNPVVLNVERFGGDWDWVTATTPAINIDDRSIDDLLQWASRELGYDVRYANDTTRQRASDGDLKGSIEMPPEQAVRTWMSTTGFEWRIDGGVIYVGKHD